jgi:outer membrane protein
MVITKHKMSAMWTIGLSIFLQVSILGVTENLPVLTLSDAVKGALAENYGIRLSLVEAESARRNASPGQAGFLPALSVDSSISSKKGDSASTFTSGSVEDVKGVRSNASSTTVVATQTLFRGLGGFASLRKLETFAHLSELEVRHTIEIKVSEVITSYVEVIRLQDEFDIAKETVKISEERLQRSRSRQEFGAATTLESLNAQVDWESDKGNLLEKEVQFYNAKRHLNFLMARDLHQNFDVVSVVPLNHHLDLNQLRERAHKSSLSVKLLEGNKALTQADRDLLVSSLFPVIVLSGGYALSSSTSGSGWVSKSDANQWSATVGVSLPLFDGFKRFDALGQLELSEKALAIEKTHVHAVLERELAKDFALYKSYLSLHDLGKNNVKSAQLNFDRALDLFKLGQLTGTELREIQVSLLRAKNKASSYAFLAKLSETNLLRLSGQLWSGF